MSPRLEKPRVWGLNPVIGKNSFSWQERIISDEWLFFPFSDVTETCISQKFSKFSQNAKNIERKTAKEISWSAFQLLAVSFLRTISLCVVETSNMIFKNHSAEKRFFGIIAFRKCQKTESVLTFVKLGILLSPGAQSSIFSCMFYCKAFYLYKAIPLKTLWFHFLRQILDRSVKRQKNQLFWNLWL